MKKPTKKTTKRATYKIKPGKPRTAVTPLTEKELDALEVLVGSATEGPWAEDDGHIFSKPLNKQRYAHFLDKTKPRKKDYVPGFPFGSVATCSQDFPNGENDSEAIVALRNHAMALITEIRFSRSMLRLLQSTRILQPAPRAKCARIIKRGGHEYACTRETHDQGYHTIHTKRRGYLFVDDHGRERR